jgi:hypothetical protein
MKLPARAGWGGLAIVLLLVAGCSATSPPAPLLAIGEGSATSPPARQLATARGGGGEVSAAAGELVARRTDAGPIVDGRVDAAWAGAVPLRGSLTWGIRGTEHALDIELRALYTPETLYFLAQWPEATPSGPADATANKLTVHWQIETPAGSPPPACDVVCHSAFADGQRRLAYILAETIPPGSDEALPAAGGWRDGVWTLEWSRPLVSDNPYDLQFTDLSRSYSFFVKVFEGVEGRPDPVSAPYVLVFRSS